MLEWNLILFEDHLQYNFITYSELLKMNIWVTWWAEDSGILFHLFAVLDQAVSLSNLQCVVDSCREEERATADVVEINTQLFSLLIPLQIPPSSPPLFQQSPLITGLYLCFPFVRVSVERSSLCESVSGITCLLECVYLYSRDIYVLYVCMCV